MRSILWTVLVVLCASGLISPVASASPLQASQASNTGQASGGVGAEFQRELQEADSCKRGCHDCWYKYFPGAVNYCLGMRDWKNGAHRSGLELLDLAAGWGNKNAQYALGLIFFNGHHVAVDKAQGMAWLMLANQRHNDAQTSLVLRSAVHKATVKQYKQAQRLFRKMRKRYGDKVAAVRAWRHLRNRLKAPGAWSSSACILEGGGTVPWSQDIASNPHVLCMSSGPFRKSMAHIVDRYFKGLTGTVTIGALQQVPASASSSTR